MFDVFKSVLTKNKTPSEDEINKVSSYQFCRWLSGSHQTIFDANLLNQYDKIPMINQYHLIKGKYAGKIKFIPYPKNTKINDEKTLNYLMDYFKISSEKAREYITIVSETEINTIKEMYERK